MMLLDVTKSVIGKRVGNPCSKWYEFEKRDQFWHHVSERSNISAPFVCVCVCVRACVRVCVM